MIDMTVQVPDALASRIQSFGEWFPTILELSLLDFETKARESVSDVIKFLGKNPSPQEVLQYQASEKSQRRLGRLLALNKDGLLSLAENLELNELEQLEHILIMLKAKVAKEYNLKP
jgi:hypothetical protein